MGISEGFWLSDEQWQRLAPLLPNKSRGVKRVDDRRGISGIVHVPRSGGRWTDVPTSYGPRKTLYNRFVRWAAKGIWAELFTRWGRRRPASRVAAPQHPCVRASLRDRRQCSDAWIPSMIASPSWCGSGPRVPSAASPNSHGAGGRLDRFTDHLESKPGILDIRSRDRRLRAGARDGPPGGSAARSGID